MNAIHSMARAHVRVPGAAPRAATVLRSLLMTIALVALLGLTACGGGGGGGDPVAQPTVAITAQPSDQATTAGQTATFRVGIAGSGTVHWQRLEGAWVDIPGATGAELVLVNPGDAEDGRQYRAQLRDGAGAVLLTSSAVTLRVAPRRLAPAVVSEPVDVQVRAGQASSFTVTASGTSLAYQWQTSRDGANWIDVADARTETLTLSTITVADSGRLFRAVVRNELGSATSRAVTLGVLPALRRPVFTQQPQDRSVEAGQVATFTATSSGEPAPQMRWESSRSGQGWAPIANATTATLVLPAATLAEDGLRVRAVAVNAEGEVLSDEARLTVVPAPVAPVVTQAPRDLIVTMPQAAALEAAASGLPTPTYQWQVSVDGGTNFTNINGATSTRLELPTTTSADDGRLFRIVASNRLGDVASAAARLTVWSVPTVTLQPQDATSGVSQAGIAVTVAGIGQPQPAVQWQASGDEGATYHDIPGATASTYAWSATRDDDRQLVRARLSNDAGQVYSQAARIRKARWTHVSPNFVGVPLNDVRWLDAQVAVAVGDDGVLVRTADAGLTWQLVREAMNGQARLTQLEVLDARTVIAGGTGGVLWRSEDAGLSWRSIALPFTDPINAITFRTPSVGLLNSFDGGMLRTVDGGFTWTRAAPPDPAQPFDQLGEVRMRGQIAVAMGIRGWYRSTDGGATWVMPPDQTGFFGFLYRTTFVDDQTVFAVGWNLLRSTDAGATWQVMPPLGGVYVPRGALRFDASGQIAIETTGDMRSVDGGVTWAFRGADRAITGADLGANGIGLAVSEHGELRRSTDLGATWGPSFGGAGVDRMELWSVTFPDNDSRGFSFGRMADSTDFGLMETLDGGRSWHQTQRFAQNVNGPRSPNNADVSFIDAQTGMAAWENGSLLKTVDGGRSWQPVTGMYGLFNHRGLVMLDASTVLLATDQGISRSEDGGLTFTRTLHVGFGDPWPNLLTARNGVVLAPADFGRIFRSTDGGRTWTTVRRPGFGYMHASAAWSSDTTVFVVDWVGGLHRSDDAGLTWRQVLGDQNIGNNAGRIAFSSDGRMGVFVMYSSIYRTSDGGDTWNLDLRRSTMAEYRAVGFAGPRNPVVVGGPGMVSIGSGY